MPPAKMYVTIINSLLRGRKVEAAKEKLAAMEADGHKIGKALRDKVNAAAGQE